MIVVTAAVIERNINEVLICQRKSDTHNAGLWEFPGGKIDPQESLKDCLKREISEELGVDIEVRDLFEASLHNYPDRTVLIIAYKCRIVSGELECLDCQSYEWVKRKDLLTYSLSGGDVKIARKLQEDADHISWQTEECPFCDVKPDRIVAENPYGYAVFDEYPVVPGHLLVIPWKHIPDFFHCEKEIRDGLMELVYQSKEIILKKFPTEGFNIGMNCGKSAGQSVMHLHIHVLPRKSGDVINPAGGVRNILKGKICSD